MHEIKIYRKIIERKYTPENSTTNNRIKNISKELILILHTNNVPNKDDILIINDNKYIVKHIIRKYNNIMEKQTIGNEEITIEVERFSTTHIYRSGSNSFEEDIPLVCDIK